MLRLRNDPLALRRQVRPRFDNVVRPSGLPAPRCRVVLVCGPVAAGKSTYVAERVSPDDVVIDLDLIAREFGLDRDRSSKTTRILLTERCERLAALAIGSQRRTAWVIMTAPSECLRAWWAGALRVADGDLVLLVPTREELRRRILADESRAKVRQLHFRLVDEWFDRERRNDPGWVDTRCDARGFPLDPLHPWNRKA